jgi:hypothetical protein
MSHVEDYRRLRRLMAKALAARTDPEQVAWTVAEGVASIIDGTVGAGFAGMAVGALGSLRTGFGTVSGIDCVPNPWFVSNGHADDDSDISYTRTYLRNRGFKSVVGGLLGLAGSGASAVTQVDVSGIAIHANAVASTSIHLVKLKAIGARHKQSQTITEWIDVIIRMKALKAMVRGTQLAGAAIPVGAGGMATGIGAAAVKLGITLTYTKVCAMTAADIHWRAFQEQAISGGFLGRTGQIGPASNMMYELFCRRGATRVFGQYDVDRIIREPTGWMCLNDKLMLI